MSTIKKTSVQSQIAININRKRDMDLLKQKNYHLMKRQNFIVAQQIVAAQNFGTNNILKLSKL